MSATGRNGMVALYVRDVDELRRSLAAHPGQRRGYEDARLGMPPRSRDADGWDEFAQLTYEQGRLMAAELGALREAVVLPAWDLTVPPDALLTMCLAWLARHPAEFLMPPTFVASEVAEDRESLASVHGAQGAP